MALTDKKFVDKNVLGVVIEKVGLKFKSVASSVETVLADAKTYTDKAIEALKNGYDGTLKAIVDLIDAEKERATKAEKVNADAITAMKDETDSTSLAGKLAAEVTRATKAESDLGTRVSTIEGDYLKAADKTALEKADSEISTRVKAIEDDYLKKEDKYDDTALADRVTTLENTVNNETTGLAATKAIADAAKEKAEAALPKDTYDAFLAGDFKTVKDKIDTFLAQAELDSEDKNVIDTLKELQAYIASDETAASAMTADIAALKTTVGDSNSGLVKDVAALKTTVGDSNSGLVKDVADVKDALDSTKADSLASKVAANTQAIADETTNRTTAVSNAISTAADDATTKANAAKADAISTAADDATTKANAAEASAKAYTDTLESAINVNFMTEAEVTELLENAGIVEKAQSGD